MKKYLLAVLCAGFVSGCTTLNNGSTYEQKQLNIKNISQIACSATLATIQDSNERIKLANHIYCVSRAAYSLTDGRVPSVEELKITIANFGGSIANLDRYKGLIESIGQIYASELASIKDNSNKAKLTIDILMSIAAGAENAASVYIK